MGSEGEGRLGYGVRDANACRTELKYRRWVRPYHRQVIRDDIRNEFAARQIDTMVALYSLITNRVGRPISASNQTTLLKFFF
jgi:hypothetical protein